MQTQTTKTGLTQVAAARRDVMRAIFQDVYGSADRLRLAEVDKPVIAADEVLASVRGWRGPGHVSSDEGRAIPDADPRFRVPRAEEPRPPVWTWRARSPRSAAT
jgi:hypothetical protein